MKAYINRKYNNNTTKKMDEDTLFKTFHQSQIYALDSDQISSREKAERLRHTMFFYHGLLSQGKVSCESHRVLTSSLSSEYSSVVDSIGKPNGLNNYRDLLQPTQDRNIKTSTSQWETGFSLQDRQPICSKEDAQKEEVSVRINFSKLNNIESNHSSADHLKKKEISMNNRGATVSKLNIFNSNNGTVMSPSKKASVQPHVSSYENTRPRNIHPQNGRPQNNRNENVHLQNGQPQKIYIVDNGGSENARLKFSRDRPSKSITYGNDPGKTIDEDILDERNNPFRTAGEQFVIGQQRNKNSSISAQDYGSKKRSLGTRRTGLTGKFVPPVGRNENGTGSNGRQAYNDDTKKSSKYEGYEWMKNIDERMIELIENEIMDHGQPVNWDDIAGLEFAKTTIQEIVIWPMLRPDIFTGLRGPPKGLLLFGPPGTGKTLIGKCIASQSNATFFSISASSLTSKWVGEGEKMVRALFGVARCHQPSVIFIDEIDSLLISRSDSEHESSRRIKTEFLVQLDGATCTTNERVLVVGATNRPQELDEAARRRLVKRLYIPLPEKHARTQIVVNLLTTQSNKISEGELNNIAAKTNGFSGADMATLCREAALGPIRTITDIKNIDARDVRPVNINDFEMALRHVRPSVSKSDLQQYVDWNLTYGSSGGEH